jgi:hypothetical protein
MIKRLAGVITAAMLDGQRSRRAGRVAPVPAVLIRASLVIASAVALAVAASPGPAQATAPKPGNRIDEVLRPSVAAAPGSGWSVVPSPNPRAGNGLFGAAQGPAVSCPTTSVCTAVGLHVRGSGLGVTLAERRSGGRWAVQPTPNPRGAAASALNGVSCPSGPACTAVGQFVAGSGVQRTLAERWNGSSWRIQPTPNPKGSPSSRLFAVACPAADTCTAVGTSNSTLLVERRGGARWRIQPVPVPRGAQFSELNAVTCTAATSCMAVGDYVNSSGLDVTLAERWNGARWAIQPTPNPSGAQSFSALSGVSCTARDACEASGTSDVGAFAERWNGTRWRLQAVPPPRGAQFALLSGVSCAASACEAVGGYVDRSGTFVPLAERWNGTAWQAQPAPNPARASMNFLFGVSCPSSSDCTAAGQGNGAGTPFTLGERWRDGRWSIEAVLSPVGAAENQLNGIACPATDRCVAVGTVGPTRGVVSTEALAWNGTAWRLQHIPTLPGAGLNGVTCASETDCVAVGGSNAGPLAEHWNGKTWAIQPTPNPSSQPQNALIGVACPTSAACIAVGATFDASGNPTGTFAERWNGTNWKLQRTPTQHTPGGLLASVWCQSATACIATGGTNAGTLAERLSGTTWTVQRTPNPPDTQGDSFNSVSCTSLSACTGVGMAFAPGGFPPQTLAERWNGARWRIQPTPLLPGIGDLSNFSVACPAPSVCIAAGGFENDGPGAKTLTEQWRGSGTATAQIAPAASSPRAHLGIAGCTRAAIGEGSTTGAAATRLGPTIKAPMPQRSQPASKIERITALCSAA